MTSVTFSSALGDQARGLRALLRQRSATSLPATPGCRSIAVTSGKGGVGKSVLTLNLAVALAEFGAKVCLLDGHQGLGNLDLLCNRHGYWNLSHVVAGARQLEDVILDGPAGVRLIPGAGSLTELGACPEAARDQLRHDLDQLAASFDYLLLDVGSGRHDGVRQLIQAADEVLVITTPDPMALAEAYATIKSISTASIHVAVNQATKEQAGRILHRLQHTTHTFLRKSLSFGAAIPNDPAVNESVRQRLPFMLASPDSPASRAVKQLARQLASMERRCHDWRYFERLMGKG
jgi:flagellar biosynthesis protein FlhG